MTLETLTRGLFDYAGMFPPASLSFTDALRESARFPETLHRPDLVAADMVVSAGDYGRLDGAVLEAHGFDRPCRVCVVGVPAGSSTEWAKRLADPAHGIQPVSLEVHGKDPRADVAGLHDALEHMPGGLRLFYEPKWTAQRWRDGGAGLAPTLAALPGVGLKVRCAGETGLDAAALATAVHGVAHRGVPFKATQGLHHPFARDPRYGNEHGFLNVAVALRLTQALGLDVATVKAILEDAEPASFVFDAGLGWREHRILAQRLQEAMALPFTIGSCSLAEPDADLAASA